MEPNVNLMNTVHAHERSQVPYLGDWIQLDQFMVKADMLLLVYIQSCNSQLLNIFRQ